MTWIECLFCAFFVLSSEAFVGLWSILNTSAPNLKVYKKIKAKNWTMHESKWPGREIQPIPFTGPAEFFRPNLTDKELKGMLDEHGDIRFSKIYEWMLLTDVWRHVFLWFFVGEDAQLIKAKFIIVLMPKRLFLLTTLHASLGSTGRKVHSEAKGMMTVQLVMPLEEPPTDDTLRCWRISSDNRRGAFTRARRWKSMQGVFGKIAQGNG